MQRLIENWLNKPQKEYYTGLAIFKTCNPDAALYKQLAKGKSAANLSLLINSLTKIIQPNTSVQSEIKIIKSTTAAETSTLYNSAKEAADLAYKVLMNNRAVLFSKVNNLLAHEDVNAPHLIEERRLLSINVAQDWIKVSKLYEIVDFVKEHGHLPHTVVEKEKNITGIPDSLVKQHLDNARKYRSKLKKKAATPSNIDKLNELEKQIPQLESRWQLLKP